MEIPIDTPTYSVKTSDSYRNDLFETFQSDFLAEFFWNSDSNNRPTIMQTSESIYTDHRKQNARLLQGILITAAIFLVLLGGVWIWKSMEIRSVNRKADEYRELVKEQATRQVIQAQEGQLKSMAKPLVWALRTEMMKGNLDKVNVYIDDLIKEKNIQSITITNPKGKIISSSDRKMVGKPFVSPWESTEKIGNETRVKQVDENTLIVASPIMGFNSQLGTVFLQYTLQPLML